MSQTSHLSRYRPAVFAITGVAAACGIYILFTTFSGEPAKSGLHRSNAVHRRRQPPISIGYEVPGLDTPLGCVVVRMGSTTYSTDVNNDGAPRTADLRGRFPDVSEEFYSQKALDLQAVQSVMNACFLAQGSESRIARLRECGVAEITEAMQTRDVSRILALATPLLHQIVDTDHETIQVATMDFLIHVGLAGADRRSGEDSQPQQGAADSIPGNSDFAETEDLSAGDDSIPQPEQGLKGLLYHIAETDAKRKAYEHRGITCEECGEKPIRGVRWHCLNCPDYDLCSTCEASTAHQKTHVFVKIKIPLPILSQPSKMHPLWYPGETRRIYHALPTEMKTYFRATHEFDEPHLDAYFDQFTSLANRSWKEDPAQVKAAIDRRAFNKALTSERWPHRFRPNALYDRMFAFYDTDNNGLIGFGEFLNGIAYLRGPKRFTPLSRALQGFDIDEDGYVDRTDFLRLLRAKYEVQRQLISDMVESQEAEQTQAAMETLHSSQPISSIFSWDEIPSGEERTPVGKARDANGDLQPLEGTNTILEDDEGWQDEGSRRRQRLPAQPHEQLQHHLSRFEELLSSPTDGANSQDGEPSMNEVAANGAVAVKDNTAEKPLDGDVIWQLVEDGFNEILDPLFQAKEEEHRRVIEARPQLEKWKPEIELVMKEKEELKKSLQEELQASDTVDPLLATAVNSLNGSVSARPKEDGGASGLASSNFKTDIVPTDHESLTKREEEIAQKPLDELLSATGYSSIDDEGAGKTSPAATMNGVAQDADKDWEPRPKSPDSEFARILGVDGSGSPPSKSAQAEAGFDPTMPQNRPNSYVPTPGPSKAPASSNAQPDPQTAKPDQRSYNVDHGHDAPPALPRKSHLEYLGTLIPLDEEITQRGGPGRLSFDEIEAIVKSDTSKELKGLVTGWLEWASF